MADPMHTEYHPRWLRQPVSTWWWLQRKSYFTFILREVSSVFVAWTVVYLLTLVAALGRGADAYREFLVWSASPPVLLLNLVSFLFLVFHAVTWFNLAPRAMVVHVGGKRVSAALIVLSNYAAWAVVSVAVIWLLLEA